MKQPYYCQVLDTEGLPFRSTVQELELDKAIEWANLLSCEQWLQGTPVSLYQFQDGWKELDNWTEIARFLDGQELKLCQECRQYRPEDERVEEGMKCGECAYK